VKCRQGLSNAYVSVRVYMRLIDAGYVWFPICTCTLYTMEDAAGGSWDSSYMLVDFLDKKGGLFVSSICSSSLVGIFSLFVLV
jgi:hypothetical protein